MAQPPVALHCQGENCCEIGHGILGFCLPEGMKYESSNEDNGQQVLSAVPFLRAGNPGPEQQAAVDKGCEVASQPGEKGLAGRREHCFCEPGQGSFIVFCKNLIDPKALKGGVVPLRCVLFHEKDDCIAGGLQEMGENALQIPSDQRQMGLSIALYRVLSCTEVIIVPTGPKLTAGLQSHADPTNVGKTIA